MDKSTQSANDSSSLLPHSFPVSPLLLVTGTFTYRKGKLITCKAMDFSSIQTPRKHIGAQAICLVCKAFPSMTKGVNFQILKDNTIATGRVELHHHLLPISNQVLELVCSTEDNSTALHLNRSKDVAYQLKVFCTSQVVSGGFSPC